MPSTERPNPFYLNIILLNKAEVITKKVNEKAGITPSRLELEHFTSLINNNDILLYHLYDLVEYSSE